MSNAINFTPNFIKSMVINNFNKINNTEISPDLSLLEFVNTGKNDEFILQDVSSNRGVIASKIYINEIFPKVIDLRQYKNTSLANKLPITDINADKINNLYSTELIKIDPVSPINETLLDSKDVSDFVLFCNVFGFYELAINDVHLGKAGDKLIISVDEHNTIFTGYLEVLV